MTTPAILTKETTPIISKPKISTAEKKPIFREGTIYNRIYSVLEKYENKPTTKKEILARLKKNGCKEADMKLLFGLNVILSIREDGSAHRRLNRLAKETYWVEMKHDGIFIFHKRSK